MLLNFVKLVVEHLPFVNDFLIISNKNNNVSLINNELEIIIYHDIIQNEIEIDFDMTLYFKTKINVIENSVLIKIDKLIDYLDIDLYDSKLNCILNKDDKIKARCDLFVKVWSNLMASGNCVNKLFEIISTENTRLNNKKEIRFFDLVNFNKMELFNSQNYKKNVRLLYCHKNKLNGYDLKTLYHSMNSVNI